MKRAVRTLVRLIASGFILFGGLQIAYELIAHFGRGDEISIWLCLIGGVLMLIGCVLFWTSARIAERLTEDFEE